MPEQDTRRREDEDGDGPRNLRDRRHCNHVRDFGDYFSNRKKIDYKSRGGAGASVKFAEWQDKGT